MIHEFKGPTSQITSAAYQPISAKLSNSKASVNDALALVTSFDGTIYLYDHRISGGLAKKLPNNLGSSPPWTFSVNIFGAVFDLTGKTVYCQLKYFIQL